MHFRILAAAAAVSVLLIPSVPAQVTATFEQSYPYTASFAVATDGNRIFSQAGGGVFALVDTTTGSPNPVLDTSSGVIENQLRTGGVTFDIALTPDAVYTASWVAGLVRFPRPELDPPRTLTTVGHARAVDTVVWDNKELSFIVSTDDGQGHLYPALVDLFDEPMTLELQASKLLSDDPAYAVDAYLSDEDEVTVLVGTACGEVDAEGAGLMRFEFDLSGGVPTSIDDPTDWWSVPNGGGTFPTFIRDIVIDEEAEVAYVAAYDRGVYKFDLSGGDLTPVLTSGWPYTPSGIGAGPFRAVSLALHEPMTSSSLLLVAYGERYPDDRQVYGGCYNPTACAEISSTLSTWKGIRLVDVSSSSPDDVGSIEEYNKDDCAPPGAADCPIRLPGMPFQMAVQAIDSGTFRIDVACGSHGLQVVEAEYDGPDWILEWNDHGFDTADEVPTGGADDIIELGDWLVCSNESGPTVFDATIAESDPTDEEALRVPLAADGGGSILISGMPAQGNLPNLVVTHAQADGVKFYRIDEGTGTTVTSLGLFSTQGKCNRARLYSSDVTPGGLPWLVVVNGNDAGTACIRPTQKATGGLRVYALDNALHFNPTDHIDFVGGFLPNPCATGGDDGYGTYFDVQLEFPSSGNDFAAYVLYGADPDLEDTAGVIVLKGTWTASPPGVSFEYVGRAAAFDDAEDPTVAKLEMADGRLYGAFACYGVAVFATAAPGSMITWDPETDVFASDYHVWLHAAEIDGTLFVCTLDGPLTVFDKDFVADGPYWTMDTQYQPNAVIPAPSSVSGAPAVYLVDGVGGFVRVQFSGDP